MHACERQQNPAHLAEPAAQIHLPYCLMIASVQAASNLEQITPSSNSAHLAEPAAQIDLHDKCDQALLGGAAACAACFNDRILRARMPTHNLHLKPGQQVTTGHAQRKRSSGA